MNSIRRFFANFQREGTISWISGRRVKVAVNGGSTNVKGSKTATNEVSRTDNVDKILLPEDPIDGIKDNTEETSNSSEVLKNTDKHNDPSVDTKSINRVDVDKNTTKCLEEFDEILQGINRNVSNESVSLDDVLNNMTEEENKEFLHFEIPRLDLYDLVQNFGIFIENSDDVEPLGDIFDPNKFVDELDNNTNTVIVSDEEDVISISSEDSQVCEFNLKLKENEGTHERENVKLNTKELTVVLNMNNDTITESSKDLNVELKGLSSEDNSDNRECKENETVIGKDIIRSITDGPKDLDNEQGDSQSQDIVFIYDTNNNCEPKQTEHIKSYIKVTTSEIKNANDELDTSSIPQDIVLVEDIIPQDIVKIDDIIACEPKDRDESLNNNNDKITDDFINRDDKIEGPTQDSLTQDIACIDTINCEDKERDEPKIEKTDKLSNVIDKNESSDVNCQNIVSIESHSEPKNVKNENSEPKNRNENESNVYKEIDSDDCGYQSSDFEFITEDEAKLDGLIVNFNPNTKIEIPKPKMVKTIEISVDKFSSAIVSSVRTGPDRNEHEPSNEINYTRPVPNQGIFRLLLDNSEASQNGSSKEISKTSTCMQECYPNIRSSLRNVRRTRGCNLETQNASLNYFENGFGNAFRLGTGNTQTDNRTNIHQRNDSLSHPGSSQSQGNVPDINHTRPGLVAINYPDSNNHGPGYSQHCPGPRTGLSQDNPGTSHFGCPRPSDRIERWRAFQQRNRNFTLDQSYRENHRVPNAEEYYQLFNPNFGPLPNQSIRLENKSTMSRSTMLVEYEGVGFDMRMWRGNSESEEEEVIEQADASTRKILEMYPGENRRKRRRF